MTVNISARAYRIWVCKPGQDESSGLEVTAACSGSGDGFFTATDEQLSESGIIRTTGRLVLQIPFNWNGESFSSWDNPERWAIGNYIIVKVADSQGVLRLHPRSHLYILKDPLPPYPNNPSITLELGDRLTLFDYRQPDDDKSGVEFGANSDRTEIVEKLLETVGIEFAGQIPLYPINYPIPKTQSSFVAQAGAVAIGGLRALYQDEQGRIQAQPLNLRPAARLLKQTVGLDDADGFTPLQGSERPVSLVKAAGVGYKITATRDSGSTETEEYLPKESIVEGDGSANILAIKTTETWSWQGNQYQRRISEQKVRGLLLDDAFFEQLGIDPIGSPYQLITSKVATETSIYESSEEGRLERTIYKSREVRGAVLRDYYLSNPPDNNPGFLSLMNAEDSLTTYRYKSGTQTESIKSRKLEPMGKIAGKANNWADLVGGNPDLLLTSETSQQSWVEVNKGEWEERETVRKAARVSSGSIASFLSLGTVRDRVTTSRSGESQPPAANTRKPKRNREEQQIEGEARYKSMSGAEFSPRERTYQFEYLTEKKQAEQLADLFGNLLKSRHQGFRVMSAFSDEWFNYRPLCRMDVQFDGSIYLGLMDSVTWTLANDQTFIVADCMRVGKVSAPPGVDTYPADPDPDPTATSGQEILTIQRLLSVAQGAIAFGGSARHVPIEMGVELPPIDAFGGIALGGQAIAFGSGMGGTGTMTASLQGNEVSGSQTWIYFVNGEIPSDLAVLPRTVFSGYSVGSLDLTALFQQYGAGKYVFGAYKPSLTPNNFYPVTILSIESQSPEGAAIVSDTEAYDSVNLPNAPTPVLLQVLEVQDADASLSLIYEIFSS